MSIGDYREGLRNQFVAIYGLDSEYSKKYCKMCELYPGSKNWDEGLAMVLRLHKAIPGAFL